jgi:hypothetical protein
MSTLRLAICAALGTLLTVPVAADPCGMVPPIRLPTASKAAAIKRVGVQTTYVFHRNGMQTVLIHPGFEGTLHEFGMLIPFPAPPSVKKVPEDTLQHIAAAVDPPLLPVEIQDPLLYDLGGLTVSGSADSEGYGGLSFEAPKLAVDEVRIVRQEALGMYELAVIEAGSARALDTWMSDHGFAYPGGMDDTVSDYVNDRWYFVAVKARVGQAPGVAPRPGMRDVDPDLPAGAKFDGHVQAMAFRFEVEEPVVPMRLAVFNGEDTHNLVYMLTERPVRIVDLDQALVTRQLGGKDLYANITEPLELAVTGGKRSELPTRFLQSIAPQRDPGPYNGIARDLFATDLAASRTGQLTLDVERREKALLEVSETLGLRGNAIDKMHRAELLEGYSAAEEAALSDLEDMWLTVIDGEFSREHISAFNLTFEPYQMPGEANTIAAYNARERGPGHTPAPPLQIYFRR